MMAPMEYPTANVTPPPRIALRTALASDRGVIALLEEHTDTEPGERADDHADEGALPRGDR